MKRGAGAELFSLFVSVAFTLCAVFASPENSARVLGAFGATQTVIALVLLGVWLGERTK